MCRNIRTLFNFEPPATEEEIRASALQFVRKLSGFNKPSQQNQAAFERAVDEVADAARRLMASLHTAAPSRDRAVEAEKARARARVRYGVSGAYHCPLPPARAVASVGATLVVALFHDRQGARRHKSLPGLDRELDLGGAATSTPSVLHPDRFVASIQPPTAGR